MDFSIRWAIALMLVATCYAVDAIHFANSLSDNETAELIGERTSFLEKANSLEQSVDRYSADVMDFFKYNISNKGKKMSFEQLKEQGGVCAHYAEYYRVKAIEEGYYAKTVTIRINKSSLHEFAVISNNEGYCIADMLNTYCNT